GRVRVVDRLLEPPAEVALAAPQPEGQPAPGGGQAADYADLVTGHLLDERGAPCPGQQRRHDPGVRLPPGPHQLASRLQLPDPLPQTIRHVTPPPIFWDLPPSPQS